MAKEKNPTSTAPAELLVVRILCDTHIDGIKYRCDDVVELPAETAAALIKSGEADAHKDAVSYATTELARPIIKHQ